jgi:hypothetical protein
MFLGCYSVWMGTMLPIFGWQYVPPKRQHTQCKNPRIDLPSIINNRESLKPIISMFTKILLNYDSWKKVYLLYYGSIWVENWITRHFLEKASYIELKKSLQPFRCWTWLRTDGQTWPLNRPFPLTQKKKTGNSVRPNTEAVSALVWTKWRWGRFPPSTSVSPANFHSTNCSTIILIYHLGLVQ